MNHIIHQSQHSVVFPHIQTSKRSVYKIRELLQLQNAKKIISHSDTTKQKEKKKIETFNNRSLWGYSINNKEDAMHRKKNKDSLSVTE